MTAVAPPPVERDLASSLRGFGPAGIVSMLVITLAGNLIVGPMIVVPVGALLALAWASASCTPLREIGYVRPHSWTATLVGGAAFGIALKLVMKAIVMPLFGAEPSNQAYRWPPSP